MRFCKGSKVEVLQESEVPPGSWRPAEIISGNGRTYYVTYDPYPVESGVIVDRVPRKAIRPCPPPPEDPVCWAAGDILEVFDGYSWKVAEMVRMLCKDYYLARLLGSSQELRVHASNLRLRQLWQDDEWVVIRKDSARCHGGSFRSQPKSGKFGCELARSYQQFCGAGNNHLLLKNQCVDEGDVPRGVKRKSSALSTYPTQCSAGIKRLQVSHGDGSPPLVPGYSLHLMEKVDAVDSPCLMLGEKYMHASLNKRTNGFRKTNLARVNTIADYQSRAVIPDPSDTESISSSVGSCSPSSSPYRPQDYPLADQSEGICSRADGDDEASVSGSEASLPIKDVLREETHLLELHAYRATIMALYASGTISWEQEALMTNLRLTLNISTDEHLAELRNLFSSSFR